MAIRIAQPSDIPAMLKIYEYFVQKTAVSFEYETPTEAEFLGRMQSHMAQYAWLVREENGTVLGYAYAGRAFERAAYAWCAEISCYLDASVRRKGIGRALYTEIESILRRQGCRKVFAVVTSANAPSVAFHRALGYRQAAVFRQVGYKLGEWHDVIWLEKTLCAPGAPERFPVSWEEVK